MPPRIHELDSIRDSEFLSQGRRDPVTLKSFQPGDEVVVCAECEVAHLASTWRERGECVNCGGNRSLTQLPTTAELDLTQDGPADGPVPPSGIPGSSGSAEVETSGESELSIGPRALIFTFALLLILWTVSVTSSTENISSSGNTTQKKSINEEGQPKSISAPPKAQDDQAITLEGQKVTIDVLSNDFDPDNDKIFLGEVKVVSNGSISKLKKGKVRYTPSDGFTGTAYVIYTVYDKHGKESNAKVEISVKPVKRSVLIWREAGLRVEPSRNSEIVKWINSGKKVKFIKKVDNFYLVKYADTKGYLHEGLIHPEYRR